MGGDVRGGEGGSGVGLAVGKNEDKRDADRRKAEYAADLQRQMNQPVRNAPDLEIGRGIPPAHGRHEQDIFGPPVGVQPPVVGDGGGGGAVGLQVGMRARETGPPAGGRRQNMSNMYQDDWEAQERERRKLEYARDLQGQMQHKAAMDSNGNAGGAGRAMLVNPMNNGARVANGNAGGLEMPGGGNLFGGPEVGGAQGAMPKPSISNMFGGDGGAEKDRRKQEYAQDLQNQMRLKAEADAPRAQHGGMPGDGGWGQGGAPGSFAENHSGFGAGGAGGMGGGGGVAGIGAGGFANAGMGSGGMAGGSVGVGLGDIGAGNADFGRQKGGRGAFTNMHSDPHQPNEADRKRAQYADDLRQQMEAAKAKKEREKAEEALREKQDAERLLRDQQREAALAGVARDQFGNPVLPQQPPHHPAAQAHGFNNLQQMPGQITGLAPSGAGMKVGFEGGLGGRQEWEAGGMQGNVAGMASPLRGQMQPVGPGHTPTQAPQRVRGRSDGPPPPPQPLNEIQAELQQMIEEKKRRKEKEEWEEKERERKDNERLERQRAELAAQAAKELEKKLAKDAAAAAAGGGGGNLLARTPLAAGGQSYLGADAGSPHQRRPADTGGGSVRAPLFGRRSSAAGEGAGQGVGGLHVRVEDSVDGPLAPAQAGGSPALGVSCC